MRKRRTKRSKGDQNQISKPKPNQNTDLLFGLVAMPNYQTQADYLALCFVWFFLFNHGPPPPSLFAPSQKQQLACSISSAWNYLACCPSCPRRPRRPQSAQSRWQRERRGQRRRNGEGIKQGGGGGTPPFFLISRF